MLHFSSQGFIKIVLFLVFYSVFSLNDVVVFIAG